MRVLCAVVHCVIGVFSFVVGGVGVARDLRCAIYSAVRLKIEVKECLAIAIWMKWIRIVNS